MTSLQSSTESLRKTFFSNIGGYGSPLKNSLRGWNEYLEFCPASAQTNNPLFALVALVVLIVSLSLLGFE